MLVLSRKKEESVMVGGDIEVMIVEVRGDKVRLGFLAPETVPVHRKEVYQAMLRDGEKVVSLAPIAASHAQDAPKSITAIIGGLDALLTSIKKRLEKDKLGSFQASELERLFIQLVALVEGDGQ